MISVQSIHLSKPCTQIKCDFNLITSIFHLVSAHTTPFSEHSSLPCKIHTYTNIIQQTIYLFIFSISLQLLCNLLIAVCCLPWTKWYDNRRIKMILKFVFFCMNGRTEKETVTIFAAVMAPIITKLGTDKQVIIFNIPDSDAQKIRRFFSTFYCSQLVDVRCDFYFVIRFWCVAATNCIPVKS